jgi:hypothetical protein
MDVLMFKVKESRCSVKREMKWEASILVRYVDIKKV